MKRFVLLAALIASRADASDDAFELGLAKFQAEDFAAAVPLLARVYPNGSGDVNDFH